jgi:protoporphyrinogen/coproporphyrinogen III oxidase
MQKTNILVIGAGLTGLTTAYYLNKKNADFKVIEQSDTFGGVIKSVTENGFTYEEGPNTGVLGTPEVVELLEELASHCTADVAGDNVKKRFILKNGKWEQMPLGLVQAVKTPLFTTKDKFRLLGEPFRKPGIDPHESLAQLVCRRMGRSFLDYAIDPFILGVYAGDPNLLVTKYAMPKLYNLEQNYGSFIGGSIKKMFGKKDPALKKVTRKVFSVMGGLSNLTTALYKSSGEKNFIFSAKDISVTPVESGYVVNFMQNGQLVSIACNKVITTTGAFALPEILPFVAAEKMQKLTSLLYTRVIEVVLGFKVWKGMNLDGFGGLIPHKENRQILGALFLSSLLKDRAPENGALITLFMGGVRKSNLVDLPDSEIEQIVKREISDLMQIQNFAPDLFKIIRHKHAIPQYSASSGERFETIEALQNQYKGLILGGNMCDGIGMADRVKQGKRLAELAVNQQDLI